MNTASYQPLYPENTEFEQGRALGEKFLAIAICDRAFNSPIPHPLTKAFWRQATEPDYVKIRKFIDSEEGLRYLKQTKFEGCQRLASMLEILEAVDNLEEVLHFAAQTKKRQRI